MNKRGVVLILSGPSGSGKDTILAKLLREDPDIMLSISATTRRMRQGEQDGVHYHFVSEAEFRRLIDADALYEYNKYCGNYYGTQREPMDRWLQEGKCVILEIDVNGAQQIRNIFPEYFSIFIMPPSVEELEKRIRNRQSESEEAIRRRVATAVSEMEHAKDYDYVVVNDQLDEAVAEIRTIIHEWLDKANHA